MIVPAPLVRLLVVDVAKRTPDALQYLVLRSPSPRVSDAQRRERKPRTRHARNFPAAPRGLDTGVPGPVKRKARSGFRLFPEIEKCSSREVFQECIV